MAAAESESSGGAVPNSNAGPSGTLSILLYEIFSSPLNLILLSIITFIFYKMFKSQQESRQRSEPEEAPLPKLKKKDYTMEELRKFDGTGQDGRILVAVNGKVFDVTKGRRFYGPGAPYAAFAGKDASRGLATFSVDGNDREYDDLSDLEEVQMESVKEWEMQFTERYDYVGKLLKPGQPPASYSDEEDDTSQQEGSEKSKDE